ncbi:MAG TPA: ABC transporter substrate-binding protein [Candidatus Paceibacterota bacterium]|nr:ABC transporter substrate-binding protein [Candidatus Paceibacterota bacterium]HMO82869.1 ABC transporter substrate-binding protein [Candidatus Paceibacterota bacterium]
MPSQPKRHTLLDKFLALIESRKPSDRLFLRLLFFSLLALSILFAFNLNRDNSFPTPTRGGTLIEGIIGIPRFVNPALAITRADQDTVSLLYSGLMRIDSSGNLVPDIAESITLSEDGTEYSIIVRKDRIFHDGTPITARDVVYTMKLVQDSNLKSPLRGNWSDVTVNEVGEYELQVVLREAYSPFLENFTLGIMPLHIWSTLPIEQLPFSQHNTEPVGSGPFAIKQIKRNPSGLISSYVLQPALNSESNPNLAAIELVFFQNEVDLEKAFTDKLINSTVYIPNERIAALATKAQIISHPMPRVFGIFFNQNRSPALRDKAAREALSVAINREELIANVLSGYGVPTTKPILDAEVTLESSSTDSVVNSSSSLDVARKILLAGNWEQNDLGFWEKKIGQTTETLALTIKTSNSSLFDRTVNLVAADWRELGVEVQVEQYEQTDLVQSVIRTRDFQALLFGLDMNRTQDLYPFWHSSQKDDPGLNISQYTNIAVDRLLEKTKNSQDQVERKQLLQEISTAISEEVPAIMLFAPSMVYVLDKSIITTPITGIGRPSDRFMNVSDWYAKTEILWPFFQTQNIVNDIN